MKRFIGFTITILVGAVLGLAYGWLVNPVRYEDITPSMLRSDYKTDYILMVAEIYGADKNLEQAARRLAQIDSQPPAQVAAAAGVTARNLGYATRDLDLIDKLARDLQAGASGAGAPTAQASATAPAAATAAASDTPTPGGQP